MPYKPHEMLLEYLDPPTDPDEAGPVLDLACGTGRSGLKLAQRGIPVVLADRSTVALEGIRQHLSQLKLHARTWQVDLEQAAVNPLEGQVFSAIICFRYLHRPLFPNLLKAVEPGGLIIYETFTTDNRRFGRPTNPDFLLKPNELKTWFHHWELIHYYEDGHNELYNITKDISEKTDLTRKKSRDYQDKERKLLNQIISWLTQTTPGWNPAYPADRATGKKLTAPRL